MTANLPPMASGLFGYLGYSTVGLIERLPDTNPDTLGIPDGILVRPTIVCIFDNVFGTVDRGDAGLAGHNPGARSL